MGPAIPASTCVAAAQSLPTCVWPLGSRPGAGHCLSEECGRVPRWGAAQDGSWGGPWAGTVPRAGAGTRAAATPPRPRAAREPAGGRACLPRPLVLGARLPPVIPGLVPAAPGGLLGTGVRRAHTRSSPEALAVGFGIRAPSPLGLQLGSQFPLEATDLSSFPSWERRSQQVQGGAAAAPSRRAEAHAEALCSGRRRWRAAGGPCGSPSCVS